jgi:hypothetical protein
MNADTALMGGTGIDSKKISIRRLKTAGGYHSDLCEPGWALIAVW